MVEPNRAYVEKVDKLFIDMYQGSGQNNPSITTRLAMLERLMQTQIEDTLKLDVDINGNDKTPGLKSEHQEVLNYIKSGVLWIKGIAWFLVFACGLGMLWIASLEYRHKLGDNSTHDKSFLQEKFDSRLSAHE